MEKPSSPSAEVYADGSAKTSGLAITSLVLGILAIMTVCVGIGVLFALAGLVLGIVGLTKIGKPGQPAGGQGLAIAGVSTSGVGLLMSLVMVPMLIGIMLPAFGAAQRTAHQMQSNTQARGIQQAMVIHAQTQTPDANGDRPMTDDLGELLLGNYFTVDYTQSPLDAVGGDVPVDFASWTPDAQADWVRVNSDFVIVPGLVDDLDTAKIALFGKPDRFDGGIPVSRNDNSTSWEVDTLYVDQQLQAQTGKTMAELIADADAEAMAGTPTP